MDGEGRDDPLDEFDSVEVSAAGAAPRRMASGERLVFGRGHDVDLPLGDDPWLSRRAGEIVVLAEGVRIANLSRKQALLVQSGGGEPVRLPARTPEGSAEAFLLRAGSALVGSAAMLQGRQGVHVAVPWVIPAEPGTLLELARQTSTEARIRMNVETREFMVALLLCRPWLEDPDRLERLPSRPELAVRALEVTSAQNVLHLISRDPQSRERLTGKIQGHLRELRRKLARHGLLREDETVGNSAIATALLHFDIIGRRHLAFLDDEHWLTVQQTKWWNCM